MAKNRRAQKQVNAPTPKEPSIIVQNLTVRPANRKTQDIQSWMSALKSAEATNPRRTELYDLYSDILLDGRLSSVVEKRIMAITNADWEFVKDGKVIPLANDMIDTPEFEDLLTEIMSARFWGYAMAEILFDGYRFNLFPIPKKHMRPEQGKIAIDQSGDGTIDIQNNNIHRSRIIEVGKKKDLGILLKAAQYVIYKRGNFGDWAQFAELFGMPFRKGTYNGFDDSQRVELENALEKMGGAAYVVLPDGSNVEFIENKTNSNGELYDKLRNACNEELSVLILGQTMTTDNGSSRSQGEVHKEVEEGINKADRRWVRRWLNTRFLEVMEANGVKTEGGYFVIKGEDEEKISIKERLEMHLKMIKELGLPYDPDHFYEEYGLPKPVDYNSQKEAQEKSKVPDDPDPAKEVEKTPEKEVTKDKEKKNLFMQNAERFFSFFQPAPIETIGAKATCCTDHLTNNITLADVLPEFDNDALINRFWKAGGSLSFDAGLFYHTAKTLLDGFMQGWKAKPTQLVDVGFEYGIDDPAMLTSYEINLFRFAGAKTLYEAQQLNKLFRQTKTFDEFYQAASRLLKVHNKEWLMTERNTAIAVGESSAAYLRLIKQTEIFPYWQYKTLRDDRVRDDHRILHDFVARWDDPIWKKLFPPLGYGCRCYIAPRMEHEVTEEMLKKSKEMSAAYFTTDDWVKAKKSGFGVNRADIGEVFTANQQYISELDKGNKLLSSLNASDYNRMKSSEAMLKYGKKDINKEKVDPDEFYKSHVVENSFEVKDYNNRTLFLDKESFDKYSSESKYLNELENVLKSPDEVWLNSTTAGKNPDRFTYIKYYKQEPLIVFGKLIEGNLFKIDGWQVLSNEKERFGLLTKG